MTGARLVLGHELDSYARTESRRREPPAFTPDDATRCATAAVVRAAERRVHA